MTESEVRSLRAALEQLRGEVAANNGQFAAFKEQRLKRDVALDDRWSANIRWGIGVAAPLFVLIVLALTGWLWDFTAKHASRVSVVENKIETMEDAVRDGFNALRSDLSDIRTDIRTDRQRADARRVGR